MGESGMAKMLAARNGSCILDFIGCYWRLMGDEMLKDLRFTIIIQIGIPPVGRDFMDILMYGKDDLWAGTRRWSDESEVIIWTKRK